MKRGQSVNLCVSLVPGVHNHASGVSDGEVRIYGEGDARGGVEDVPRRQPPGETVDNSVR